MPAMAKRVGRGKKRVSEQFLSVPSSQLRHKPMKTSGFSVWICLTPCYFWERWKREEVQGIYQEEGQCVSSCPLLCFVMVCGWQELAEISCFSLGSNWTPCPPTQDLEWPHSDHSLKGMCHFYMKPGNSLKFYANMCVYVCMYVHSWNGTGAHAWQAGRFIFFGKMSL